MSRTSPLVGHVDSPGLSVYPHTLLWYCYKAYLKVEDKSSISIEALLRFTHTNIDRRIK